MFGDFESKVPDFEIKHETNFVKLTICFHVTICLEGRRKEGKGWRNIKRNICLLPSMNEVRKPQGKERLQIPVVLQNVKHLLNNYLELLSSFSL